MAVKVKMAGSNDAASGLDTAKDAGNVIATVGGKTITVAQVYESIPDNVKVVQRTHSQSSTKVLTI